MPHGCASPAGRSCWRGGVGAVPVRRPCDLDSCGVSRGCLEPAVDVGGPGGRTPAGVGRAGIDCQLPGLPDGRSLLAASSLTDVSGLWVVDLARGDWTGSRRTGSRCCGRTTEDGAYTSRAGHDIYVRRASDEAAAQPLLRDQTVKVLNEWSRDGPPHRLRPARRGDEVDLWLLPIGGGTARPLLQTSFNEAQARLSRTGAGSRMSRTSPEPGNVRAPLSGHGRSASDLGWGWGQPQWRADQKELFYLAQDRWLMSVAVDGSDSLSYGAPRRFFRSSIAAGRSAARDSYAAMSDRQSFLIDGRHAGTATHRSR